MARTKHPATRGDLEAMTKEDLASLADEHGLAVARSDGEAGEPLKDDYVNALALGLGTSAAAQPSKSVRLTERVYFEGQIYGPGAEEDDFMVDIPEDYPETREPKAKAKAK